MILDSTSQGFAAAEGADGAWYVEGIASHASANMAQFAPKEVQPTALKVMPSALHDLVAWSKVFPTVFRNHDTNEEIGCVVESAVLDGDKYWVKVLISKTRPDIWTKILEGVLCKFSVSFIPQETSIGSEEGVNKPINQVDRLVGLELSIVGLSMHHMADISKAYSEGAGELNYTNAATWEGTAQRQGMTAIATFKLEGSPEKVEQASRSVVGRQLLHVKDGIVGRIKQAYPCGDRLCVLAEFTKEVAGDSLRLHGFVRQNANEVTDFLPAFVEVATAAPKENLMNRNQLIAEIKAKLAAYKAKQYEDKDVAEMELAGLHARLEDPSVPLPLSVENWDAPLSPVETAPAVAPVVEPVVAPVVVAPVVVDPVVTEAPKAPEVKPAPTVAEIAAAAVAGLVDAAQDAGDKVEPIGASPTISQAMTALMGAIKQDLVLPETAKTEFNAEAAALLKKVEAAITVEQSAKTADIGALRQSMEAQFAAQLATFKAEAMAAVKAAQDGAAAEVAKAQAALLAREEVIKQSIDKIQSMTFSGPGGSPPPPVVPAVNPNKPMTREDLINSWGSGNLVTTK